MRAKRKQAPNHAELRVINSNNEGRKIWNGKGEFNPVIRAGVQNIMSRGRRDVALISKELYRTEHCLSGKFCEFNLPVNARCC